MIDAERQRIAAYADASAAALGIALPANCREGVVTNLETLFQQAATLMSVSLLVEDEASPLFQAGYAAGD